MLPILYGSEFAMLCAIMMAAALRRLDPAAGGAALMRLASESPALVERLFVDMDPLTAEVRVCD